MKETRVKSENRLNHVTSLQLVCKTPILQLKILMLSPFGAGGTTKALSSTSLRGSVTSTLSPADTTSSLTVTENSKGLDVMPRSQCGGSKNTGIGQTVEHSTGKE